MCARSSRATIVDKPLIVGSLAGSAGNFADAVALIASGGCPLDSNARADSLPL